MGEGGGRPERRREGWAEVGLEKTVFFSKHQKKKTFIKMLLWKKNMY